VESIFSVHPKRSPAVLFFQAQKYPGLHNWQFAQTLSDHGVPSRTTNSFPGFGQTVCLIHGALLLLSQSSKAFLSYFPLLAPHFSSAFFSHFLPGSSTLIHTLSFKGEPGKTTTVLGLAWQV
jgi:hypothetical protein